MNLHFIFCNIWIYIFFNRCNVDSNLPLFFWTTTATASALWLCLVWLLFILFSLLLWQRRQQLLLLFMVFDNGLNWNGLVLPSHIRSFVSQYILYVIFSLNRYKNGVPNNTIRAASIHTHTHCPTDWPTDRPTNRPSQFNSNKLLLYKYKTIYVLSLSDRNTFVFAVSHSLTHYFSVLSVCILFRNSQCKSTSKLWTFTEVDIRQSASS